MKKSKKLQEYRPNQPKFGENAIYLKDEEGRDWYDIQKEFQLGTLKIAYDPDTGLIMGAGFNIGNPDEPDSFWPAGLSVAETNLYPADFVFELNTWVYDDVTDVVRRRVSYIDQLKEKAAQDIKKKTQTIMSLITPLQVASQINMISEEDAEKLLRLQTYVVLLNQVPKQDTYPTGIVWPEVPTTT